MKVIMAGLLLAAVGAGACADVPTQDDPISGVSASARATVAAPGNARTGFSLNGTVGQAVSLTGGGSADLITASDVVPSETAVGSGGGFRCVAAVAQGPLAGCAAGEGVRWDAVQLLATTGFRCSGADAVKTSATGKENVVLLADFYRAGDGIEESFTARMIVSTSDIAADVPGVQTLWVQGVGCGDAAVRFSN
ncbi:MAG TPA: hypothetical protein VGD27_01570 [Longimicrobiales bacterium]